MSKSLDLEAEAHDWIAKGHENIARGNALLAEARRVAAAEAPGDKPSWILPGSVYPKRHELALARSGAVESSKVGRRVLIGRRSLEAYVTRHARESLPPAETADEDLFR